MEQFFTVSRRYQSYTWPSGLFTLFWLFLCEIQVAGLVVLSEESDVPSLLKRTVRTRATRLAGWRRRHQLLRDLWSWEDRSPDLAQSISFLMKTRENEPTGRYQVKKCTSANDPIHEHERSGLTGAHSRHMPTPGAFKC